MSEKNPDNIPGIAPEDVAAIPRENLQRIAEEVAGTITPPTSEDNDAAIETHDHEIEEAAHVLLDLQFKYQDRPRSFENLTSLRQEAKDKFNKIGLEVEVTWTTERPLIEIIGRITSFDLERQYFDVKKGVADKFWDQGRK